MADYTSCACCNRHFEYDDDYELEPKREFCEQCSKTIFELTKETVNSFESFIELISTKSDSEELIAFLKNIGFVLSSFTNPVDEVIMGALTEKEYLLLKNGYKPAEPMKIFVLAARGKYFISDTGRVENTPPKRSTKLGNYYVDGAIPELGYTNGWYVVDDVPSRIQSLIPKKVINHRWVVKDDMISSLQVINPDFKRVIYGINEPAMSSAYSLKFNEIGEHFEDVDFVLEYLETDGKTVPGYYPLFNPWYSMDSIITCPTHLLDSKPCAVSGKSLYALFRDHIKKNIDPRYARITSDYDFCFTVKKVVNIEPYEIEYDASKTKKPKLVKKLITNTEITVYENSPEGYSKYPKQPDWFADSTEAMDKKIKDYLVELMETINAPVKQCPHCKGTGVVVI